jgi:aminocarboxymuconate-semialdehyde decarboxylase
MLYADTALNGSAAATTCGHAFFGSNQVLFASDAPFDSQGGKQLIQGAIDAVNALDIDVANRNRIFETNTRTLLRLDN